MPEVAYNSAKNGAGFTDPLAKVYLLIGSDDALKREAVGRLVEAGLDASFADFDRETLDFGAGGNATEDGDDPAMRILAAAGAVPFGSPRKVVTVNGVQKLAKDRQEALAAGIGRLGQMTLLILVADAPEFEAGRPKGRQVENALKKAAAAAGMVVSCDPLQGGDLKARARALIAQSGKRADEAVIAALVGRATSVSGAAGGDLNTLTQETEKLITYVGERGEITAADADLLIAQNSDETIFPLLDAIGARNAKKALDLTDALLDSGEKPDAVVARSLVMLARHFRILSLAKYLAERHVSRGALPADAKELLSGELIGVATGQAYRLPGYARQAANFTWDELRQALARILLSDLAMKAIPPAASLGRQAPAGSDEPAANLRLLVLALCRRDVATV